MPGRIRVAGVLGLALLLPGCVQAPPPAQELGVLLSAAPARQAAEDPGGGAIAGVVLGAAAGGALGRGAGRVIGAAIGSAVGGTAGAAVGGAVQPTDGAAYTVRLPDGRVVTIVQHLRDGEAMLPAGQPVILETRGRLQRVTAAPVPG